MKKLISLLLSLIFILCTFVPFVFATDGTGEEDIFAPLVGKTIGTLSGSVCDVSATKRIKDIKIEYYNSVSDLAVALDMGKIDGFSIDEPLAKMAIRSYENQYIVDEYLDILSYAPAFRKTEEGDRLREEFNVFLARLRETGTLDIIFDIWTGGDDSLKTCDYESLTGENGVIKVGLLTVVGEPFGYMRDNKFAGYELDILVRFCKEMGYALDIYDVDVNSCIVGLTAGKFDIVMGTLTITQERGQSVNFSSPTYLGGTVIVTKRETQKQKNNELASLPLAGKKIGIVTGTVFDSTVWKYCPSVMVDYYKSISDLAKAVEDGTLYGYIADKSNADFSCTEYSNQHVVDGFLDEMEYGYIFPKDDAESDKLRIEFNEFLDKIKSNGEFDSIYNKWITADDSIGGINLNLLPNDGRIIKYAVCYNTAGAPNTYLINGKPAGFEIEIVYNFCMEHGYGLEIYNYDSTDLISTLAGKAADIGSGNITINSERKNVINFSDPYYSSGAVLVIKNNQEYADKAGAETENKDKSFIGNIKESFTKTFINESRWKLFLNGIYATLVITVLSVIMGTLLGFIEYLFEREGGIFAKMTLDVISWLIRGMPVVVFLMIFFYVIFGGTSLSGLWVSVICFTLIFASSVHGLIRTGVSAIDIGQTEAGIALGYTKMGTFVKIVLPQAVDIVLPSYMSQIVELIKSTSVVGYIAVQDLTKVGDIVRSRTYDAFFPLISTAIIYYALAALINFGISRYVKKTTYTKIKSKSKYLKGVKTV